MAYSPYSIEFLLDLHIQATVSSVYCTYHRYLDSDPSLNFSSIFFSIQFNFHQSSHQFFTFSTPPILLFYLTNTVFYHLSFIFTYFTSPFPLLPYYTVSYTFFTSIPYPYRPLPLLPPPFPISCNYHILILFPFSLPRSLFIVLNLPLYF